MTTPGNQPLQLVPEEVLAVGRFAGGVAEQLRSGSTSLDRDVQALFTTWKGTAADAYSAGWDEVHDAAKKAWDALAELAEKLGTGAVKFQGQDDTSASSMRSLRAE